MDMTMKRFVLTLLLAVVSLGAWAQYAPGAQSGVQSSVQPNVQSGVVKRSGTHLKVDGERMSEAAQAALLADIGGIDYNAAWQQASAGRRLGTGLTVGGSIVMLGGLGAVTVGLLVSVTGAAIGGLAGSIGGQEGAQQGAEAGASAGTPYMTGGLIASGVGLAAMGFGIPKLITSNRKLNKIVDAYNTGSTSAQLTLGPTANGFGLVLSF